MRDAMTVEVKEAVKVNVGLNVAVSEGTIVGVVRTPENASTVNAAAVFTLAIAISMILRGLRFAAEFGSCRAIPAGTHSKLTPRAAATTTHRRPTYSLMFASGAIVSLCTLIPFIRGASTFAM